MTKLENDQLTVHINPHGAELKTIFHRPSNKHLLWPGVEGIWPRSSPVLFPIVGRLKDNTYRYKGKSYELPQHGFARDMEFALAEKTPTRAAFRLESDYKTLEKYPFSFILDVAYELDKACLRAYYTVTNTAREDMYFSLGAHPGFMCGAVKSKKDVKAVMRLDMGRELLIYRLANGLLQTEPTEGVISSFEARIDLTDELIENDAMVFKAPPGRWVDLLVPGQPILRMIAKDWPYYGIWSREGAPFVCLEPWYGLADSVNTNQELTEKEGIQKLGAGKTFSATWSIEARPEQTLAG